MRYLYADDLNLANVTCETERIPESLNKLVKTSDVKERLWHLDPLLSNNHEIRSHTIAISV
jgi:hypothetical protein